MNRSSVNGSKVFGVNYVAECNRPRLSLKPDDRRVFFSKTKNWEIEQEVRFVQSVYNMFYGSKEDRPIPGKSKFKTLSGQVNQILENKGQQKFDEIHEFQKWIEGINDANDPILTSLGCHFDNHLFEFLEKYSYFSMNPKALISITFGDLLYGNLLNITPTLRPEAGLFILNNWLNSKQKQDKNQMKKLLCLLIGKTFSHVTWYKMAYENGKYVKSEIEAKDRDNILSHFAERLE